MVTSLGIYSNLGSLGIEGGDSLTRGTCRGIGIQIDYYM
jgi:hypothetical protein